LQTVCKTVRRTFTVGTAGPSVSPCAYRSEIGHDEWPPPRPRPSTGLQLAARRSRRAQRFGSAASANSSRRADPSSNHHRSIRRWTGRSGRLGLLQPSEGVLRTATVVFGLGTPIWPLWEPVEFIVLQDTDGG
jgi:hypothetical protein